MLSCSTKYRFFQFLYSAPCLVSHPSLTLPNEACWIGVVSRSDSSMERVLGEEEVDAPWPQN